MRSAGCRHCDVGRPPGGPPSPRESQVIPGWPPGRATKVDPSAPPPPVGPEPPPDPARPRGATNERNPPCRHRRTPPDERFGSRSRPAPIGVEPVGPRRRLGPGRHRRAPLRRPRRPAWRTRRRQAWLGAGDHGSATLLNAHRAAAARPEAPDPARRLSRGRPEPPRSGAATVPGSSEVRTDARWSEETDSGCHGPLPRPSRRHPGRSHHRSRVRHDERRPALVHRPIRRPRGLGAAERLGRLGPDHVEPGPALRPSASAGLDARPASLARRPGHHLRGRPHRGHPVGQLRQLLDRLGARAVRRLVAKHGGGLGRGGHVAAAGGRADVAGPATPAPQGLAPDPRRQLPPVRTGHAPRLHRRDRRRIARLHRRRRSGDPGRRRSHRQAGHRGHRSGPPARPDAGDPTQPDAPPPVAGETPSCSPGLLWCASWPATRRRR